MRLNGLDLFSGIGEIGVGLKKWVTTVAYCERDRYAQGVLLSRMQSREIDVGPIWDNVTTLKGAMLPNIDIIFGGFPCQDLSVAGLGAGLGGERSGLFYEIIRLTKEIKPSFVFLENVPAIRTRGLREVIRAFAEVGYDCRWTCLSAASVGAPHKRERWFLLAHTNRKRVLSEHKTRVDTKGELLQATRRQRTSSDDNSELCETMAHSGGKRLEGYNGPASAHAEPSKHLRKEWWQTEPDVGRVVNGLPLRVDRIKCLGNSVVPIQVKTAFEKLMGIK
jgi:DNA (cytosine-5)-methyltransferase 1